MEVVSRRLWHCNWAFWVLRARFCFACFLTVLNFPAIAQTEETAQETLTAENTAMAMPAITQPNEIPVEYFSRLPEVTGISLSPDGQYYAALYRVEGQLALVINQVGAGLSADIFLYKPSKNQAVSTIPWFHWISNDEVVFSVDSYGGLQITLINRNSIAFSFVRRGQIAVVRKDGSDLSLLYSYAYNPMTGQRPAELLHDLPNDPDHVLISVPNEQSIYPKVVKFNLRNGDQIEMQASQEPMLTWLADRNGVVKLGIGHDRKKGRIMLLRDENGGWRNLHEHPLFQDQAFQPLGLSYDPNILLAHSSIPNGRRTIYRFNLASGTIADKVFEHPRVDTLGVVFSPKTKDIAAVSFVVDKLEYEFFDDDLARVMNKLNRKFPNNANAVSDISEDGRYFLIYSEGPTHPGIYYRFDDQENVLQILGELYPDIPTTLLADMKRVNYFTRDGIEISAYLTIPLDSDGKDLPTVIMPHGGPWVRDMLDYNPWVQFLASRGYAVFQPNFRGSSGYGMIFQNMGNSEWGRAMQNDVTDGVQWLISQSIADPSRICIVGASYGGYAALIGASQQPQIYQCAAALAPVTDIKKHLKSKSWMPWHKEYEKQIIGGLSRKEIDAITPMRLAKNVSVPILLIHGAYDHTVESEQSSDYAKRLKRYKKPHKYVLLEGADHNMREEKDATVVLSELEAFLAEHIWSPPLHGQKP